MNDNSVEIEKPQLGRVRKRTHAELVSRLRQLEDVAGKREWQVRVLIDNVEAEGEPAEAINASPSDSEVMLLMGPNGSAPAMIERYQLLKTTGQTTHEGEMAGLLRDMRGFLQVQYTVADRSAALADKALSAMDKTIDACGKMARAATKATSKQFKARKQALALQEKNDGFIASSLKEVGEILGPEKSAQVLGMALEWLDSKLSSKKPKTRRKVAKGKPRAKKGGARRGRKR